MKVKFKEISNDLSIKIMDMPLKKVLVVLASQVSKLKLPGTTLRVKTDSFTFDINAYKNEPLNSDKGN